MNNCFTRVLGFIFFVSLSQLIAQTPPVGTGFTYQGRLMANNSPANGLYSFQFRLIQTNNGQYQGPIITNQPVVVSNGLFTTVLDFGDIFGSRGFALEIGVRTNGNTGAFTFLSPNQSIAPAPLAMVAGRALSLGNPLPPSTIFEASDDFPPFSVNSTARVARLNVDLLDGYDSDAFWKLGGNSGGSSVLGTLDSRSVILAVSGVTGWRIDPATNAGSVFPNVVGGALSSVTGASAGTISGGRENTIDQSFTATISGGWRNKILFGGQDNSIGGGQSSTIQSNGIGNTIGGGALNQTDVSVQYGTISGGRGNRLGDGNLNSTIGGGRNNATESAASHGTIGGGSNNIAGAIAASVLGGVNNRVSSSYAAITGGANNFIQNVTFEPFPSQLSDGSIIGGGQGNSVSGAFEFPFGRTESSLDCVIGGGATNAIYGASYATIPGGVNNSVTGHYGMAAGRRAKVNHDGSFVWADSTDADFASTGLNQFAIRATGGVRLSDSTPSLSFGATTRQMLNLWGTQYGIGVQSATVYFRCDNAAPENGFIWYRGGTHNDGYANAGGGTELMHLVAGGLYVNGAFVSSSDRNAKQDFRDVDVRSVLEKVAKLPLRTWSYTNDPATKHIGPMTQDFSAAFAVGPDDKHIATVDADGVALAAIQGLNEKVERQAREIQAKDQRLSELEKRLAHLERAIRLGKSSD